MATLLNLYRVRELYLNKKPVVELRMGSTVLWRSDELSGDVVLHVFTDMVEEGKESIRCILVHNSDAVFDADIDLNTMLSKNEENYSALISFDEAVLDADGDPDDIMAQATEGLTSLLFYIPVVHDGSDDVGQETENCGRLLSVEDGVLRAAIPLGCHMVSSGRILCLHGIEKTLYAMKLASERASSGNGITIHGASAKAPATVSTQLGIRVTMEFVVGDNFVYPDMAPHFLHFSSGRMILTDSAEIDGEIPLTTDTISSGTFVAYDDTAYINDRVAPVMAVAKSGNLVANTDNNLAAVNADAIMNTAADTRESLLPFDAQTLESDADIGEDGSPLLQRIVSDDQDANTEVALVEEPGDRTLLVGGDALPVELAEELKVWEAVEAELYCRWIYPERIGDALRIVQVYTAEADDGGGLSLT